MKPKIAIWHNLPSGGGKRALYNHIKALVKAGYELEAWTTDMASEDYLPLNDLIIEHHSPIKDKMLEAYGIKNILKQEQRKIAIMEEHCLKVANEMKTGGFDLLFANACEFSYMPYIGRFIEIPAIVYLGEPYRIHHEAMPVNPWQAPYNKLQIKKIKRLYRDYFITYSKRLRVKKEIESAASYTKILVNSLFSRENVIRAYGLEAAVCYLGIDTDYFKNAPHQKEPYVVGLGSFGKIKGVHYAIESIALIPKEIRPDLKWICNGMDPNYHKDMLALCKQKDVTLEVFQNIADSALINIVSKAAVMIYTPRLEPFGLAPLEGNACGTYVVAIAEGGVRESIINGINGSLINGFVPNEIARELQKLTCDLNLASRLGFQASEFVKMKWNIDFLEKNILDNIEKVLQDNQKIQFTS